MTRMIIQSISRSKSVFQLFHAHSEYKSRRMGSKGLKKQELLRLTGHENVVVERILKWTYCGISLDKTGVRKEFKIKILEASTKLSLKGADCDICRFCQD